MSHVRSISPGVSVTNAKTDGIRRELRDILEGHVIESVSVTAEQVILTTDQGRSVSIMSPSGLQKAN